MKCPGWRQRPSTEPLCLLDCRRISLWILSMSIYHPLLSPWPTSSPPSSSLLSSTMRTTRLRSRSASRWWGTADPHSWTVYIYSPFFTSEVYLKKNCIRKQVTYLPLKDDAKSGTGYLKSVLSEMINWCKPQGAKRQFGHPATSVLMTFFPFLCRCVFMRLTSIGVLLFSLWSQITKCDKEHCMCGYNHKLYSVSHFLA